MKTISTSLVHQLYLPEFSTASTHPTVIMLHGLGADEHDLPGIAQFLDDRLMVLSVRAPYSLQHGGGYTWYDMEQVGTPEPTTFASSCERLRTFFCDALLHYPIDTHRLFLLGFSMGSVMSFAMALTQPYLFRGVIANSGYVPEGTGLSLLWEQLSTVDFFIAHGTADPVIPIEFARRARDLFEHSNAQVTYKEYPMAHEISQESLNDIATWLALRLNQ